MTKLQRVFLEDLRAHRALNADEFYQPAAGLGRTVKSVVMRGWAGCIIFQDGATFRCGYRITKSGLRALDSASRPLEEA